VVARGVAIGLLTAAVALGTAELVAAFVGELASPIVAVGQAAIDLAPMWLKDFAIRTFGTQDKLVLLIGIGVLLAAFAAAMGVLALRHRWFGYAGLLVFGAIGLAAAVSRPTHDTLSPLPSVVGVIAGVWALNALLRSAGASREVAVAMPGGRGTNGAGGEPAFDRRRFLMTGLAVGGAAVVTGLGSRVVNRSTSQAESSRAALRIPRPSDVAPVPAGTDLHVPGLSPFMTPTSRFYRVDTALIVPKVDARDWRLRLHGMVDREMTVDMAALLARPLIERDITLTCVSNEVGGTYVGNARWIGAPLNPLLEEAGVHPGATQIVTRSADGFTVGTPTAVVMDGRDAMLAVAMNGQPLPLAHGFPVRMIVPGLYGYVSATKWIVDMELTTFGAFDAYWVRQGWAQQAPIKTESRIDTPRSGQRLTAQTVPVAGVAWAQHKGIERVEVRIDEDAWQEARLSVQDTVDTWRQWVYEWPATPGQHRIQVRATDRTGYTQTSAEAPPPPNGATGWHTIFVLVS
jgi:DMSO/TMAO reductase YedYZ molybdopterin-dependent catalytic subunit